MTLCADFPVILFQWLWLKPNSLCTLSEFFLQRALSDDGTSLVLSLYSFIIVTGCVSIDPENKRNHYMFVGSFLLSTVFSSRKVAQKELFYIHIVCFLCHWFCLSLGLSWYSFIILTGLVSVDSEQKESLHFLLGSCLVSFVFSSRTGCTDRTLSHPQSGSGAG